MFFGLRVVDGRPDLTSFSLVSRPLENAYTIQTPVHMITLHHRTLAVLSRKFQWHFSRIVLVFLQYIETRNFPDVGFRFYLCATSRIKMKSQAASWTAIANYWITLLLKCTAIHVFLKYIKKDTKNLEMFFRLVFFKYLML